MRTLAIFSKQAITTYLMQQSVDQSIDKLVAYVGELSCPALDPERHRLHSVSQKNLPDVLSQFFQNGWEFFDQIVHAYYAFRSTLDCEFLFKYLQL